MEVENVTGFVGFWEPVTATLDWCENNYEVTQYIAEFWNTISSLLICVVGMIALTICFQFKLERRFFVLQSLVILVGFGSAAYHGTLLYSMQMWDELPMVWALLSWYYVLFQVHAPYRNGSKKVMLLLVGYGVGWGIVHYYGKLTTAFQLHFSAMIVFAVLRVYFIRNRHELKEFWFMMKTFAIIQGVATTFWLIDKLFCDFVSTALPFNPQFHAYWHVMMAINCAYGGQFLTAMRLKTLNHNPKKIYILGLPFVIPGDFSPVLQFDNNNADEGSADLYNEDNSKET